MADSIRVSVIYADPALQIEIPIDVGASATVDDAIRMAAAGFDAVLVGEMLVRSPDATVAVRGLAGVRRHRR